MSIKVLLIGRSGIVLEDAKDQLQMPDLELFAATDLAQSRRFFRTMQFSMCSWALAWSSTKGLRLCALSSKTARTLRCI